MPPELLAAILQAEQSEPSVRTAALLRIARVLAKADQGEAERLLDRGLALLAELPEEERAAIAVEKRLDRPGRRAGIAPPAPTLRRHDRLAASAEHRHRRVTAR